MNRLVRRALVATSLLAAGMVVPARAVAPVAAPGFQTVEPRRILDTRETSTPLAAGETRPIDVSSFVPPGVGGVALNIIGVEATEPTTISVWPGDAHRPLTAVVNVGPGTIQSNLALLDLSDDRIINLYNYSGSTHVVVDVVGWFTGDFVGITPVRAVDSRSGYGITTLAPSSRRDLPMNGLVSLPVEATAVAVNVTFFAGQTPTTIDVGPSGTESAAAQRVVLAAGQVLTQSMVAPVIDGKLSVATGEGGVDLVIDVTGWFRAGGTFASAPPTRVLETRAKTCGAAIGPKETRTLRLTKAADVSAATVSIRAENASEPTFLTLWKTGSAQPTTSNVNVMPGVVAGNLAVVEVGPAGQIEIYNNSGSVDITVDVVGVFRGTTPAGDPKPCPKPPPAPTRSGTSSATTAPATTAAPGTTAAPSASWQAEMLALVNKLRTDRGLVPLTLCGSLNRSSQSYADVLVTTGGISHTGPDGSQLPDRVKAAGYLGWTTIGENLAAGQGSVSSVMDSWIKSSAHMANLIKPEYRHLGLGRQMGLLNGNTNESWFWVQNFGANGSC